MGTQELESALNRADRRSPSARSLELGERAKIAVVFSASEQAGALGHRSIGAAHVLLGLLAEEGGLAGHALRMGGITPEAVRAALGEVSLPVEVSDERGRVAELARAEAEALGHDSVGTAHVLLGLLGESDGVALGILVGLGAEPEQLRDGLLAQLAAGHGDYERFSAAARQVVDLAEEEARSFGDAHVGTEHVLLALLRGEGSLAFEVLGSLGVTPDRARAAIARPERPTGEAQAALIPLTEHAVRAFELSRVEAHAAGCNYVQVEHILVGLARDGNDAAGRILRDLAGDLDEVRNELIRRLGAITGHQHAGYFERFTRRAAEVVIFAQEETRRLVHDEIAAEHILLGLVREQKNAAEGGLEALNVALERARQAVARGAGANPEPAAGVLPFAASTTKVFRFALLDMLWLEHDHIAPEHIALGLLREPEGLAKHVLQELEIDTDQLRAQALAALGEQWACELSPAEVELSRQEQRLRVAQREYREAANEKQRDERATRVEIAQSVVNHARGKVLPQRCREALDVLVDLATEEWLAGQPRPEDPDHRRWYQQHCWTNIESQILSAMFSPALGPEANPISGHPGGPDSTNPRRGPIPFSI